MMTKLSGFIIARLSLCYRGPGFLFPPFHYAGSDQQGVDKKAKPGGQHGPELVGMRFEAEFDRMVACRNRHPAKQIVHAEVVGLFAVQVDIPALVIIDLTEDRKLIRLRRKLIVDLFKDVIDEMDGGGAVCDGLEGYAGCVFLLDDDGIPDIDAESRACISSSPFAT